ncbi:MAG: hypothetical protein DCF32_10395 [Leptolyngbya sp.]|nr:MAG: hypothetical protein DCF32_10395 [Leptolyngbya sp.]
MQLLPMERVTTHTLLGIRFWDRLTGQVVTDGLEVKAQRLKARSQRLGKPVLGRSTPSGTIAFFGLAPSERPIDADQLLWEPEPSKEDVVIDLVDRSGRFLPTSFVAQAPFKGIFRGQGDWLASNTSLFRPEAIAEEAVGVQLWSAPTRPIPPGMAVIRAQIVIGAGADAPPAVNALVQVRATASPADGFDYYGLTDDRGILLLPIPYPPIPDPSTPETPYPPLGQQTFPLTLTIYHAPGLAQLPGSGRPDLEMLLNQPPVDIVIHRTGDELEFRPSLTVNLRFGRPLILGTALSSSSTEVESVLRIQPA